ncbi:MAG: hypothetical protein ABI990_03090 [Actinomycetota bacterium]
MRPLIGASSSVAFLPIEMEKLPPSQPRPETVLSTGREERRGRRRCSPVETGRGSGHGRLNPDGNERLTAAVGLVLLVLTIVELATLLFGLGQFLSLHVFVGFVLIPPVLLKLTSTGWRFMRYYTRSEPYRLRGAPQIAMRLLAPLLVASTVALFGTGVALGILHGHSLDVARQLHGPASVIWLILLGVHVLGYLKRALISSKQDITAASRASVNGAGVRHYVLAAAIIAGVVVGAATLPVQHAWLHLPPKHEHRGGDS